MEKNIFILSIFVALFSLFGCNKTSQAPSSPQVDNTLTFTPSATATSTPTITSTPTPFLIDNFEDNNNENLVPCSNCTNYNMGAMSIDVSNFLKGCYPLTGEPAELGSYAYGITATVRSDNVKWFMMYPQTFSASGVGTNFSAYNNLKFAYKVETNAPVGDNIVLRIIISGVTPDRLESPALVLDRRGTWDKITISIDDFTPDGNYGVTAAQVLSAVQGIKFYFFCDGNPNNFVHMSVSMDNIKFIRQ